MFSLKKSIPPEQAVQAFVESVAMQSDHSFKDWMQALMQSMADADVPSETMTAMLNRFNIKNIYFCALCALEATAIQNVFPPDVAARLYNQLDQTLKTCWKDQQDNVAGAVFKFLQRIEKEQGKNMPNDSVTFAVLEILRFQDDPQARTIVSRPSLIMPISYTLLLNGAGWWKGFSGKYKLGR